MIKQLPRRRASFRSIAHHGKRKASRFPVVSTRKKRGLCVRRTVASGGGHGAPPSAMKSSDCFRDWFKRDMSSIQRPHQFGTIQRAPV